VEAGVHQRLLHAALQEDHLAGAVVAEDVGSLRKGLQVSPVDKAADDGAAPAGVVVFGDRPDQARLIAERGVEVGAERAFPNPPAVVSPERHDVDLLAGGLAHVADIQIPGQAVEGVAPRIPEAFRIDLRAALRGAVEGVGGGNGVGEPGARVVHIDAQHLPQQQLVVLSVVLRIQLGAAVAQSEIEVAVRAERQHAAFVDGRGLRDGEEDRFVSIGDGGVAGGLVVLGDDLCTVRLADIVHKEAVVGSELGMEGDAQETLLAGEEHL